MMSTTQHVHAQSRTYSLPRDSPPLKTRKKSVSPPFSPIVSSSPEPDEDEWRESETNYFDMGNLGGGADFLGQMLANTILGYCQNHDLRSIQLLLEQYPKINLEHLDWRGMTPWLVSCYMGFNNGIRFFAEKAVNMNATDTSGNNALLIAIEKGHISTVQLLLSLGVVDVSVANFNGHNAISVAVKYLKSDKLDIMLKILYSAGVDINYFDEEGESPLMHAIRTRNHVAVKSLLARNAGFAPEDLDEDDIFNCIRDYCRAFAESQCHINYEELLQSFEQISPI